VVSLTAVLAADAAFRARAEQLAQRDGLRFASEPPTEEAWLCVDARGVSLGFEARERLRADLVSGRLAWRLRHGGGRGQAVARAVGLRRGRPAPTVLDATAGLGRDAAVLAALGCTVHAWERHPAVHALLEDALARADVDSETRTLLGGRLTLHEGDAAVPLADAAASAMDVVLLDPMHPPRRGSALPRLEMQLFRALVGEDADQSALFAAALASGARRVVVKRPAEAPPQALPDGSTPRPTAAVPGRTTRFDLYKPVGSS
jgi:16S rRNA (guanine1516-N2)-methyltransferase